MFNPKLVDGYWRIDSTVDEMLAWGRNPTTSNGRNANLLEECKNEREARSHWYGMEPEAIDSLKDWPEGRELVEKCRQELPALPALKSIKRVGAWREDGDDFCKDRFDAGLDDCWRTRVRASKPGNTILKLTCEVGGTANRTAAALAWSGALAVAICDSAESAGYRVEVEAIHCTEDTFTSGEGTLKVIKVKAADEPLMFDRLCMALACPAFFRWFLMKSSLDFSKSLNVCKSFGTTADCPYELRGDLHIGHVYNRWEAKYSAESLIRKIGRLAGEPEPEEPWRKPYVPPKYDPTPAPPVSAKAVKAKPIREPKPVIDYDY